MVHRSEPLDQGTPKREDTRDPARQICENTPVKRPFRVEKHDLHSNHFDLRLEVDGVVKSWAVSGGPSLDPSVRRLAVRTTDMKLADVRKREVASQDSVPAAVLIWDVGQWRGAGDARARLDAGRLTFALEGQRFKGTFTLTRLGKKPRDRRESWLLIKERDEFAEGTCASVNAPGVMMRKA